jgi:hypothetical protein
MDSFQAFGVTLLHFKVDFFAQMGNTHSGKSRKHWKNPDFQEYPENSHP